MIDWNSGIKPWHLVADAGFGAAMEECGFRKVGRSMWRRDGDRIAWRVALTKGYVAAPGSFRGSYGGFVKEIDELVKLYKPKRSPERMEGTSVPWHLGGTLVSDLISELGEKELEPWRRKWQAERINRTGLLGILKDFINPIPPSPNVDFSEVPFLENAGPSSLDWAFVVRTEQDVAEVTEVLLRSFRRDALPWFQERLDFDQAYPRRWGPSDYNRTTSAYWDPEYYAAAKLAGDQEWIEEMAGIAFSKAQTNIAKVWKECAKDGVFKRPYVKSGEFKPDTIVQNRLRSYLTPAVTVKAIAEAMSLHLPDFEIDFSELTYPPEPW